MELLEICNSPATQGLHQSPHLRHRSGTPYPFQLGQEGLSRTLRVSVIFCRSNRRPYKFHSVISPLVIASRSPIIMLSALPAYLVHDPQLAFQDAPTQMGHMHCLKSVAWNQTLSRVVRIGTWRCIKTSIYLLRLRFGLNN